MSEIANPNDQFRAAAQGYKRMKDPNTIKDK